MTDTLRDILGVPLALAALWWLYALATTADLWGAP